MVELIFVQFRDSKRHLVNIDSIAYVPDPTATDYREGVFTLLIGLKAGGFIELFYDSEAALINDYGKFCEIIGALNPTRGETK